jgi:hypothetical protein
MQTPVSIYFDAPKSFNLNNTKSLAGVTGLYFIFSKTTLIQYPFNKSRLLYIGMSEKKTNSIGSRLSEHFDGRSKNVGLTNYRKAEPLLFTYINFHILENIWQLRIEDLESYFILNFVEHFGVYPICNNRTGLEILSSRLTHKLNIDWEYFK